MIHAAEMPDPGELLRRLSEGGSLPAAPAASASSAPAAAAPVAVAPPEPEPVYPADFRALHDLLEAKGRHSLAVLLHDHADVVRYALPALSLRSTKALPADLAVTLKAVTGLLGGPLRRGGEATPSLFRQEQALKSEDQSRILAEPVVAAALEEFPDAEYSEVRSAQ